MAEGKTQKDQVIDALVLAFARSDMSGVAGEDALRSVLAVEYHDMVSNGVFDMALLWELLEEQPGFDADQAVPPLCLFKSWEARMGLSVQLPPQLEELSDKERALRASECRIQPAELRALFEEEAPGPRESQRMASLRETQKSPSLRDSQKTAGVRETQRLAAEQLASGTAGRTKGTRPAWLGWLAGVVAAGTFAFCGMTLYGYCNKNAEWSQMSAAQLSSELPVSKVDRLGTSVRAEVQPGWRTLDADSRRAKLHKALLGVESQGVKAIALMDQGAVVATVQRTRANAVAVWLLPSK
ncbi:MAG TPA: hypothetical protein VML75_03970 [Kofleriaceae bacterium]|nr:hypothetical protein [Kofleriaceae bacterium]